MKREWIIAIIISLVAIGGVSAYFVWQHWETQSMIKAHFMRNGMEIGSATGKDVSILRFIPLAVIGEYEGITHIYFTITVKNTGEMPLTMYITGAEPYQFDSALASATSAVVGVGESHSWDSDQIDVSYFEGTTTSFIVHTKGEYTYAGKTEVLIKDASIDLTIQPDPLGGYDVIIESSTGEIGGGAEPEPEDPIEPTCWTAGTSCKCGDPWTYKCDVGCCSGVCRVTYAAGGQYLLWECT